MKTTLKLTKYPNILGSLASGVCLAHCLATPFLFVAHAGHVHGHHSHPLWWGFIDVLFVLILFIAVFWSARHTTKQWVKYALWVSWALLTVVISNEKVGFFPIPEVAIYIPSVTLIIFHLYNRKYCKCEDSSCCI